MDLGLGGKRALAAASSKGLGLACAQGLVREGCRVALSARDEKALIAAREIIAQESGQPPLAFPGDLTQAADVRSLARARRALRAFCVERLSDYKVPERVTLLPDPLPRNARLTAKY